LNDGLVSRYAMAFISTLAALTACAPAPPPAKMTAEPSCPSPRALPRCMGGGPSTSTERYVAGPSAQGERVRVEGRLVPGAACCLSNCSNGCWLSLGLVPLKERVLTPASGPLVLLTIIDKYGQGFNSPAGGNDVPITCSGRFDYQGKRDGSYCCELEVSGQPVIATGRAVPAPRVFTGAPFCMPTDLDMPPTTPACEVGAPWRTDWSQLQAIAVEEMCEASHGN